MSHYDMQNQAVSGEVMDSDGRHDVEYWPDFWQPVPYPHNGILAFADFRGVVTMPHNDLQNRTDFGKSGPCQTMTHIF